MVTNGVNGIVFDDRPMNAMIDGIMENSLLRLYRENPEEYQAQVDEWEAENGRKIGEATTEEMALREAAWA
jgi:hypothetical protein